MRACGDGVKRFPDELAWRRVDATGRVPHANGGITTAHATAHAASRLSALPGGPMPGGPMPARHAARPRLALVVLASLACATAADKRARAAARAAALQRVPANAPAGLFATGAWFASMTGELPMHAAAGPPAPFASASAARGTAPNRVVEREFMVEVHPWRDSARVSLVFDASATGRSLRQFPEALQVRGDTMTFTLSSLIGWTDVRCRLAANGRSWGGTCHSREGSRIASLALTLPRIANAARAR